VDEIRRQSGLFVTIFQRLDEQGTMLRVATNVVTADGKRAIGTVISPRNADGIPSPVLAAVLAGKTYLGRAFVVGHWINAIYAPVFGRDGQVVGMLFAGESKESAAEFKRVFRDIRFGKSGRVFVLGGTDAQKGLFVLSMNGNRDEVNVWEETNSKGEKYIQQMVEAGVKLEPDSVGLLRFTYQNAKKEESDRMAALMYFAPWDWVIGVCADNRELEQTSVGIANYLRQMVYWFLALAVVLSGVLLLFAMGVARRITNPLARAVTLLRDIAHGDGDLTRRLPIENEDEVGKLSRYFNELMDKLQSFVREIGSGVHEVAQTAVDLKATASGMSADAVGVSDRAHQAATSTASAGANVQSVASAIEQVSSSTNAVASAGAQISSNLDNVAAAVEQMSANMNVVASSGEHMTLGMNTVASAIEEMGASLQEVAGNSAESG